MTSSRSGSVRLCWSCEKQVESAMRCSACGALLPPPGGLDAFAALGLAQVFVVDVPIAEAHYKERARACHPDRFVRDDARARSAAAAWSALLNHAWRVVREPFARAEALLALRGGGLEGAAAPPELLMEMMEMGEAQAAARQAGDAAAVSALADRARAEIAAGFSALGPLLDEAGASGPASARILMRLRYWRRFLDEVAPAEEASHG